MYAWEHRFKIMFMTFIEISALVIGWKPIVIQCCLLHSNKNHPFWAASFGFSQLIAYKILYVFLHWLSFVVLRLSSIYCIDLCFSCPLPYSTALYRELIVGVFICIFLYNRVQDSLNYVLFLNILWFYSMVRSFHAY